SAQPRAAHPDGVPSTATRMRVGAMAEQDTPPGIGMQPPGVSMGSRRRPSEAGRHRGVTSSRMPDDVHLLDATAQAELIARGEATPLELVTAAIVRLEAVDPALNAVIHPTLERAQDRAAAGDVGDGPFGGVPFLIKDLVCCE